MDFTALVAARDKLNSDIATLVAAASSPITQPTIDQLTASAVTLDNQVVAATNPVTNPTLNFSTFDANVLAFKAAVKDQQSVDNLAQVIKVNTPTS